MARRGLPANPNDTPCFQQHDPLLIIGIELRTSNDEAARTIPDHWRRFSQLQVPKNVPQRLGEDVIAVYTHFEHEGIDNHGRYSLVIGCPVQGRPEVPPGMVSVRVAPSRRVRFVVEPGRPDLVGAAWQRVWQRDDLPKTYLADYERYGPDGSIELCIGVEPGTAP
jgi:predicted transcriptional regulator YdeE